MKKLLLFIFFINSNLIFSQYLPSYIKTVIPGIEFEQEREPLKDEYIYGIWVLGFANNQIFFINPFGINKIILNGNESMIFKEVLPLDYDPLSIYPVRNHILVSGHSGSNFLYKIEENELKFIQEIQNLNLQEVWDNSNYVVLFSSSQSDAYRIYSWEEDKLKEISNFENFSGNVLGLGENNYFYFKLLDITGGIFAFNILETKKDILRESFFVPLENLDGYVIDGKAYSNYLYIISKKGIEYYFSIYEIKENPIAPKFLSKAKITESGKSIYFILGQDRKNAIFFIENKKYILADIKDPKNIILSKVYEEKEDRTIYNGNIRPILYEKNLITTSWEKIKWYTFNENDGFLLKDEKEIPHFKFADKEALSGYNFIELFLKMKKFYLYYANGDPLSETNFKFEKVIPFPQCLNDIIPDPIPIDLRYSFAFDESIIALALLNHLVTLNLNGEGACIPLEWQTEDHSNLKIIINNNKLFIFYPFKGLLIYDTGNISNPVLLKKIQRQDVFNFYLLNEKYFVFGVLKRFYNITIRDYEVIKYDEEEPFVIDSLSEKLQYEFEEYEIHQYGDWFYTQPYHYFPFIAYGYINTYPCHINSKGEWEIAPGTYFLEFYKASFPYVTSGEKFFVLDLRDRGRPRIADLRKARSVIFETYQANSTVIFKTRKGYLLYNPYGTKIPEELPFGWVDFPLQGEIIEGDILKVSGWAIDADSDGISKTYALIDNTYYGEISYGIERQDVAEAKPDYPEAINSGFSSQINISNLSMGVHRIIILAEDGKGSIGTIGIRDFYKKY